MGRTNTLDGDDTAVRLHLEKFKNYVSENFAWLMLQNSCKESRPFGPFPPEKNRVLEAEIYILFPLYSTFDFMNYCEMVPVIKLSYFQVVNTGNQAPDRHREKKSH